MKKRWIPFLLACIVLIFVVGLRLGTEFEMDRIAGTELNQQMRNTTIAVVNGDAGIMVNGNWYNYAAAIIDTLGDNFIQVSPAMAQSGLAGGIYAAVVTFPSNVSTRILSFNAVGPERVQLEFQINPNLSEQDYLETFIAITELQLAINTTLASTYVSSILRQFHDAQDHVYHIFNNNLADLLALEIITLGDFTAELELEDVPFVPIQPRELDTPFYMDQVRSFAREVSDWYRNSYAMASNQFLWMREGLFRLTDNFSAQEESWVQMMMAWTRYSEFYGMLLDEFYFDVSTHEDELRAWHADIVLWREALDIYQRQIENWHDISQYWHIDAEDWHIEYHEFLRTLNEFKVAMQEHHGLLEQSLRPVMDDLSIWRSHLETYEALLYMQYRNLRLMIEDHNDKIYITNAFLDKLSGWHNDLHNHHTHMSDWYDELISLHDELSFVRDDFGLSQDFFLSGLYDLPDVPEDLPHDGLPQLQSPMPRLTVSTGAALTVSISMIDGAYGTEEVFNLFEIADYLSEMDFYGNKNTLDDVLSDLDNLTSELVDLAEDINDLIYYINDIHVEHITVHFAQFNLALPECHCANNPPPGSAFDSNVFFTTQAAFTVSVIPTAQCEICDFLLSLEQFINELNADVSEITNTLNKTVDDLNSMAATVSEQAEKLYDYAWDLQNDILSLIPEYAGRLIAYNQNLMRYTYVFNEGINILSQWYDDLHVDIDEIYYWYLDVMDFYDGLSDLYELVQESIDDLGVWHAAALDFEDGLNDITLSEMPCIEDLMYIAYLVYGSKPDSVDEIEEVDILTWDEHIEVPPEYDGADIHDVFDVDFPLDFAAIIEVLALYRPPIFADYQVPFSVHEHFMLFAYRPESPLIPPPPRPDDFWDSLAFMHDQLLRFDVDEFLTDDIQRQIERSLIGYEAFLESIRHDINFLFEDNIWLMHDVNMEYNHFLNNLRMNAFRAAASEQESLQYAIETFAALREVTNDNTVQRLGHFASMMPESRAAAGINQGLVNFTVMPFDFVPLTIRDELHTYDPDSNIQLFIQIQNIGIWVVAGILALTLLSFPITYVIHKKRQHGESNNLKT